MNAFVKAGLALIVAALCVSALTPALNGCAAGRGGSDRFLSAVGFDPYQLSDEGEKAAERFEDAFRLYATDPDDTRPLKHFRDTYKRLHISYIEDVPEQRLIQAAINGLDKSELKPASLPANEVVERALDAMTASLDPHSAYLTPEELRESELVTTGEFGGLGIQVTEDNGFVKVIAAIEGTPADRAGIQSGDVITHLDGDPIVGQPLKHAVGVMRGAPGTRIALTIVRQGGPPFQVDIMREIITIEPVRWKRYGSIGYLRIVGFNEKTVERVEDAMVALRAERPALSGLVVDLRNNPGGLLDQSVDVADAFLDAGTIVAIRGRGGANQRAFSARPGDLARGLPMVVLINAGSASAAEIVASALQDHGRAMVMGVPSFGKGSVQTVMRLPEGGALKVTTALYYTPKGVAIQARGVQPDILLVDETDGDADAATHEADLPGAIVPAPIGSQSTSPAVNPSTCPARADAADDRPLGCALELIRAGSTDRFVAALAGHDRL